MKYKTYAFIKARHHYAEFECGFANGYVAITKDHPLFEKEYSDTIIVDNLSDIPFNGNYFGLLINAWSKRKENEISLDTAINVHGGLTFSEFPTKEWMKDSEWLTKKPKNIESLWVFGFDTAHCDDTPNNWPKEKCIEETLKLQHILENWK